MAVRAPARPTVRPPRAAASRCARPALPPPAPPGPRLPAPSQILPPSSPPRRPVFLSRVSCASAPPCPSVCCSAPVQLSPGLMLSPAPSQFPSSHRGLSRSRPSSCRPSRTPDHPCELRAPVAPHPDASQPRVYPIPVSIQPVNGEAILEEGLETGPGGTGGG